MSRRDWFVSLLALFGIGVKPKPTPPVSYNFVFTSKVTDRIVNGTHPPVKCYTQTFIDKKAEYVS